MESASNCEKVVSLEITSDGSASLSNRWPNHVISAWVGLHTSVWVQGDDGPKRKSLGYAVAACRGDSAKSAPGAE